MRILALCDSVAKAYDLWAALDGLDGVEVRALVCNNDATPLAAFNRRVRHHKVGVLRRGGLNALRFFATGALHVEAGPVDSAPALAWIAGFAPDVGLHAMGVIYRRSVIEAFRLGILNPHIGLLPPYRGRSVMEWSILHGSPTGVTSFFIDEGIDTGERIVFFEEVDVAGFPDVASAKSHLFSLDGRMFRTAIAKLLDDPGVGYLNDVREGRRYYVMSGLLQSVVEKTLEASSGGPRASRATEVARP